MITPNDPPNTRVPHSKPKPMTPNRSPIGPTTDIRTSDMIPLQHALYPIIRSIN